MSEILSWLAQHAFSIASVTFSFCLAVFFYLLNRRKGKKWQKQVQEFNNWLKEQTEQEVATLTTIEKLLPKGAKDEVAKQVAKFVPEYVQINETIIRRPALRLAQTFLEGYTYVEARTYGNEGRRLETKLAQLAEGDVVKITMKNETKVAKIQDIRTARESGDRVDFYIFKIWVKEEGY